MELPVDLPDDIEALKAMIIASEARNARKDDRIERLEKLVADFKRALFGAKSEKADPDQYQLAFEDVETAMAVVHAEDEAIDPPVGKPKPRKANRGALPKHLPRIEEIIKPNSTTCGCGTEQHVIGEDVSERLDAGLRPFILSIRPLDGPILTGPGFIGAVPRHRHPSSQVCLPILRGRYCASPSQTALNRRRHTDRGHRGQCHRQQIRGPLAALSAGPNLQPSGDRPGSLDFGRVGWQSGL